MPKLSDLFAGIGIVFGFPCILYVLLMSIGGVA